MPLRDQMRKQTNVMKPYKADITEEDYYVHPKLEQKLEGIIATIDDIDSFGTEMGNRNYLLTGPPGTGKTLGVQYVATKLGIPIFDGKNLSNPQQISQVFDQLRMQIKNVDEDGKKGKIILMLDEVDRFSSREEVVDPSQAATLNQLLGEMDGIESNHGIFIFGMTNKPDKIDYALRRTKRFSKEVEFMPPDRDGRYEILKIHAHGKGGHKFEVNDKDLEHMSNLTFGYTGADLVGLLNDAFTHAVLDKKRKKISIEDLEYALKNTKPSAIRDMPFREPSKTLGSMGGYADHKELLTRIFENSNGNMLLFYGPSGTGKTVMAEALAGEYGYNFMVVSGSEPEDKFVGETGKKIDKYLDRAKQLSPCVLLFDEIDSLVEKKGFTSHKSSWTGLLQSKLSNPIEGVYIIGTVNRPDLLNDTFKERFSHRLYFGYPSINDQERIWKIYLPEGKKDLARELITENAEVSCRSIARTQQIVSDYGLESNFEVYQSLIKDSKIDRGASKQVREQLGDSVADYRNIKKFLKQGVKK